VQASPSPLFLNISLFFYLNNFKDSREQKDKHVVLLPDPVAPIRRTFIAFSIYSEFSVIYLSIYSDLSIMFK
jgi:hypothetical protein